MNLEDLIEELDCLSNSYEDLKKKADLIDEHFALFEDNENLILNYLEPISIYCSDMNSFYISSIFSKVDTNDRKKINRIIDICLCTFYEFEYYLPIINNLLEKNGTVVYEYDVNLYGPTVNEVVKGYNTIRNHRAFITNNLGNNYMVILKQ